MAERLRSVGLDVGTTSTQMILSELRVENRSSGFSVPELEIADRKILYKSDIHFTPLKDESHVDGARLRELVEKEYHRAGIRPEAVDTGAIIITGETSRKENAREVLNALSDFAGEFVVATAGPDLESVLAAKGAGAVDYSRRSGKTVLHMDIGGGTANLALIRDGKIMATGCVNVGGRLVKLDNSGRLLYVSPVMEGLWPHVPGETVEEASLENLAQTLNQALEMAAGLRQRTALLDQLTTAGTAALPLAAPEEGMVISFSGGVADCIAHSSRWQEFGDLGPLLGRAIRQGKLCERAYVLGTETIRATVIGAGCHSTQLSGSTVFHQNVTFPIKNVPVVQVEEGQQSDLIRVVPQLLRRQEGRCVLAMPGIAAPGYREVEALARQLGAALEGREVLLCLQQDMAKALGQALAAILGEKTPILCIDRIRVGEDSYLDIGAPVGPAMPVVVKTLVMGK